jgi:ketosteroid isomerase-like protein
MRESLKAPLVLVAAAAVLAAPGCGGGGGSSEDQVSAAIKTLMHARNNNDFATVCDGLAAAQVAGIKKSSGLSCPEALHSVPGATNTKTNLQVQQIRVSGDRATVEATIHHNGGPGQDQSILMVKEDGDWKVASAGF